jgi:hypothetical protein
MGGFYGLQTLILYGWKTVMDLHKRRKIMTTVEESYQNFKSIVEDELLEILPDNEELKSLTTAYIFATLQNRSHVKDERTAREHVLSAFTSIDGFIRGLGVAYSLSGELSDEQAQKLVATWEKAALSVILAAGGVSENDLQ